MFLSYTRTKTNFCQSCGMPLENVYDYGLNADLTINKDYCRYCYFCGDFTEDITLNEMIDKIALITSSVKKISGKSAMKEASCSIPKLKRWKACKNKKGGE